MTQYLDTKYLPPLAAIIDPLEYKENLTMPKLVIDATGDECTYPHNNNTCAVLCLVSLLSRSYDRCCAVFMPDDDHYWWGMLPGETYRLMVANAEHSFATGILPLITGMTAFYQV